MRRIATRALAGFISVLALVGQSVAAPDLTADQIIEKNVAARGGLEAWHKIDSMVWAGHIESSHSPAPSLPFVLELKRPNMTRFVVQAQHQVAVRVYDGVRGWKLRPDSKGKPELLPYTSEESRFAHDSQGFDGPLIDHAAKGITVTLEGVDKIEGQQAYRLDVKLPSGADNHLWIDARTFLETRYDRASLDPFGHAGVVHEFYRDYRTIGGVQIPFVIESGADATRAADRMVIDRITLNAPLQDHMFAKPNLPGQRRTMPANVNQARARPNVRPASSGLLTPTGALPMPSFGSAQ